MPRPQDKQSIENSYKWLTKFACALWLVSLALPGFLVDSNFDSWNGAAILLIGLPFGWSQNGWAVYANICFFVAAKDLLLGRQPRWSIFLMLTFACTLPIFRGVLRNEASDDILPVVSWGWGVIIWLFSLIVLATAAGRRAEVIPKFGANFVISLLPLSLLAISYVHLNQYSNASAQEQEIYLSPSMAFTRASFCNEPLTMIDSPKLSQNAIVILAIDPELLNQGHNRPYLGLPELLRYQEGDFAWESFDRPGNGFNNSVKVRVTKSADRPILTVSKTEQGAIIQLYSQPNGPILYEQKLKIIALTSGESRYCPMSTLLSSNGLKIGFDTQLLRAIGQENILRKNEILKSEQAKTPCNIGNADVENIKGLRVWDGRQVKVPDYLFPMTGFCSDSYIVLTYIRSSLVNNARELYPYAEVYDRKTLRYLAKYNNQNLCPNANCQEVSREIARGIQISNERLVIETSMGNSIVDRYFSKSDGL